MILIPMAGMSSRFFKAGYDIPKYMLDAHGKSLFEHAVRSFEAYFKTETFLFVIRDIFNTKLFVDSQCKLLGITHFEIVVMENETRGQAETVAIALEKIAYSGPLTIFNIDTFRPGFIYPKIMAHSDGYLEVFNGKGDNWSFARPVTNNSTQVVETSEKRPISKLCSTGLYYFKRSYDYLRAFHYYLDHPKLWEKGELYVAPLYNYLISEGKEIHYHRINNNEVIFCGTPQEYEDFTK